MSSSREPRLIPTGYAVYASVTLLALCLIVYLLIFSGALPQHQLRMMSVDGWSPLGLFLHPLLHASPLYLVSSVCFLALFANALCGAIGWWRFLIVYACLSFCAAATHAWLGNGTAIGAIGLQAGLLTLHLILWPKGQIVFINSTEPAEHSDSTDKDEAKSSELDTEKRSTGAPSFKATGELSLWLTGVGWLIFTLLLAGFEDDLSPWLIMGGVVGGILVGVIIEQGGMVSRGTRTPKSLFALMKRKTVRDESPLKEIVFDAASPEAIKAAREHAGERVFKDVPEQHHAPTERLPALPVHSAEEARRRYEAREETRTPPELSKPVVQEGEIVHPFETPPQSPTPSTKTEAAPLPVAEPGEHPFHEHPPELHAEPKKHKVPTPPPMADKQAEPKKQMPAKAILSSNPPPKPPAPPPRAAGVIAPAKATSSAPPKADIIAPPKGDLSQLPKETPPPSKPQQIPEPEQPVQTPEPQETKDDEFIYLSEEAVYGAWRYLEWYDKEGNYLGRELIEDINFETLQQLFGAEEDNPMFDPIPLGNKQAEFFYPRMMNHVDLDTYDLYLVAFCEEAPC